jgi:hypothetical protein
MKKAPTLLLLAVLAGMGFIPLHILDIRDARQGRTVFMQRVSPGDTFSLTFVHSVEKSPVTDYFRIDDDFRIVLYETAFSSLNAGLPATISQGQKLTRTDRGFRLSILDQVLPEIQFWVDRQYAGTLRTGGRDVSLAGLAGNTLLQMKLRRAPLWEYAFQVID